MVLALPRLVGTAVASLGDQADLLGEQLGDGDVLAVLVRVLSIVAIALPVLGMSTSWPAWSGRSPRAPGGPPRAARGAVPWPVSRRSPWWPGWPGPGGRSRAPTARSRPTSAARCRTPCRPPCAARPRRPGRGRGAGPGRSGPRAPSCRPPTAPAGRRHGAARPCGRRPAGQQAQAAPTWVFPFNRPLPPGEGDNQAMAVNTTDGCTLYDVAFALVWADGDTVLNTNEAYALASCTECQTVAVAFQVVLIVGEANVVVPQNLSAAVNYSCVQCVTYALAQQLVVTLPESLDADSTAGLEALWKEIAAFGASIEDVPAVGDPGAAQRVRGADPGHRAGGPRGRAGSGADRPAEPPLAARDPEPAEHPAPTGRAPPTPSPRPRRRRRRRRSPRPRPQPRRPPTAAATTAPTATATATPTGHAAAADPTARRPPTPRPPRPDLSAGRLAGVQTVPVCRRAHHRAE